MYYLFASPFDSWAGSRGCQYFVESKTLSFCAMNSKCLINRLMQFHFHHFYLYTRITERHREDLLRSPSQGVTYGSSESLNRECIIHPERMLLLLGFWQSRKNVFHLPLPLALSTAKSLFSRSALEVLWRLPLSTSLIPRLEFSFPGRV